MDFDGFASDFGALRFQFHASTPLREERTAADRLEAVGDYVAEYSRDQKGPLRILILEENRQKPPKNHEKTIEIDGKSMENG